MYITISTITLDPFSKNAPGKYLVVDLTLCPRQLIDLDVSNFEYEIFDVVFCRQEQWKKLKQIFKIRHIQIDEWPRILGY